MSLNDIREFFVGNPIKVGAQSQVVYGTDDSSTPDPSSRKHTVDVPYARLIGKLKKSETKNNKKK